MRLCMFHPVDSPMERGWVGKIEDDHVIHLAAQTLQSFFAGGGLAREHAVYPRDRVRLLAPVLHPPAVRIFEDETTFAFANPAAISGPDAEIGRGASPSNTVLQGSLSLLPRLAAVIGTEGAVGGFTVLADWRDPSLLPPKDRDFALGLGPVVVTPDELDGEQIAFAVRLDGEERLRASFSGFDWKAARDLAAASTALQLGDILAAPEPARVEGIGAGQRVEIEVDGIGSLRQSVAPRAETP